MEPVYPSAGWVNLTVIPFYGCFLGGLKGNGISSCSWNLEVAAVFHLITIIAFKRQCHMSILLVYNGKSP